MGVCGARGVVGSGAHWIVLVGSGAHSEAHSGAQSGARGEVSRWLSMDRLNVYHPYEQAYILHL